MKKLYSLTIAAGLALALAGCAGNNASTPSGDKDGDGVANISDQCPNTPAGTKVSKDGCKIYVTKPNASTTIKKANSLMNQLAVSIEVKEVCNTKKNSIEDVLKVAELFNYTAKKHGVEYRRLGMTTQQYIDGAKAAVKSGAKKVVLLNKKAKPTKKSVTTEYAAWRGCAFAVSSLQLEEEGKTNWRAAVPGDGFKY